MEIHVALDPCVNLEVKFEPEEGKEMKSDGNAER